MKKFVKNFAKMHKTLTYKVTVLGLDGVGKSSLVSKFTNNVKKSDIDPTIEDTYSTSLKVDGKNIKITFLDTSYQKGTSKYRDNFMKESKCFIIVIAVNDRKSFEAVDEFINYIESIRKYNFVPIVLCCNKCDVSDKKIAELELLNFCIRRDIIIRDTSKNDDVEDVLNIVGKLVKNISAKKKFFYYVSSIYI